MGSGIANVVQLEAVFGYLYNYFNGFLGNWLIILYFVITPQLSITLVVTALSEGLAWPWRKVVRPRIQWLSVMLNSNIVVEKKRHFSHSVTKTYNVTIISSVRCVRCRTGLRFHQCITQQAQLAIQRHSDLLAPSSTARLIVIRPIVADLLYAACCVYQQSNVKLQRTKFASLDNIRHSAVDNLHFVSSVSLSPALRTKI